MKNRFNETLKAGCILVNDKTKKIGLIFREKLNDFEFPKGHLEKDETLAECAVRETAEETKRIAEINTKIKPFIEKYVTPTGEKCKCYFFVATDLGKSNNTSADTHELVWTAPDEVEHMLSYVGIIKVWQKAEKLIRKYYNF